MKWFKHYSNTTMVEPVRRVFSDLGLYGLGAMWLLVERIHLNNGKILLKEVKGLVLCRQFSKAKMEQLLSAYGIFKVNQEEGYVELGDCFPGEEDENGKPNGVRTGKPNDNTNDSTNDNTNDSTNDSTNDNTNDSASFACASSSTKKEEEKEEEREEERTLSKSPSENPAQPPEAKPAAEPAPDPLARYADKPWHDLAQQMATGEAHKGWREQIEMSLPWPELRERGAWPIIVSRVCGMAVEGGSEGRLLCESHFKNYFTFVTRNATYGARLHCELTAQLRELRRPTMPADERSFYDYMAQRYPHLMQCQELGQMSHRGLTPL